MIDVQSNVSGGTRVPRVVQVCVLADPARGGVYTAVEAFAQVLRSWCRHTILNFSDLTNVDQGDWVNLRVDTGFVARRFATIGRAERQRGWATLAGADFVVIHVPYRYHAGWAAGWCRRRRIPYVVVAHGAFDPFVFTYRAWQKRLWHWWIGRRLLRDAAAVIYTTRSEAAKAARQIGDYPHIILPFPTPAPAAVSRLAARAAFAAQFGLPAEFRLLVFLGRLHSIKRPVETVRAFVSVAPPEWLLALAGPEEGVAAATLSRIGGDAVRLLGPVFGPSKSELLAAADGLVLFSRKENLSFVVLEALARGTPVVVSDELDLARDIAEHHCGWVADARSDSGRAAALQEFFGATVAERSERGERGRLWVSTCLAEERFASEVRALVAATIARQDIGG